MIANGCAQRKSSLIAVEQCEEVQGEQGLDPLPASLRKTGAISCTVRWTAGSERGKITKREIARILLILTSGAYSRGRRPLQFPAEFDLNIERPKLSVDTIGLTLCKRSIVIAVVWPHPPTTSSTTVRSTEDTKNFVVIVSIPMWPDWLEYKDLNTSVSSR